MLTLPRLLLRGGTDALAPRLLLAARRAPLHHVRAAAATAADNAAGATDDDDTPTCVRARLAPVAGPLAEVLSDALLGFGAQSVTVAELLRPGEAEQPIFDAGGGGSGGGGDYWPRCEVVAHFALEADADAAIRAACSVAQSVADCLVAEGAAEAQPAADAGFSLPPPYLLAAVANREWVEQIKASYVPLEVVKGVVGIVPEGHEDDESGERGGEESGGAKKLKIVLRPGVAFGTGEHPTTRLCLRAVARFGGLPVPGEDDDNAAAASSSLSGASVLDYGTGSGVLAVAALLLGAARAVGTDTDPLAVRASAANARLNSVESRYEAVRVEASLPEGGEGDDPVGDALLAMAASSSPRGGGGGGGGGGGVGFEFVLANILRGPLLELSPRLARLCAPGGKLLLSGVLAEQAPEVRRVYEALGFQEFKVETEGSWAALSATKTRAG
jgi:ribosomal protein L11 methylase PrmA